ncbi:MAG: 2-hydroxymuconate tautomerase family protein [Saccharospirillum sp.]
MPESKAGMVSCFANESFTEIVYAADNDADQTGATDMPYVNIKITREGATAEQKAELIAGATELLQRVLNKDPATTVVVIDEVPTDNWGINGETVTKRRHR